MPIASYKPDVTNPTITPNLPTTEPENYKSIIYDDKNTPLHSLIAYVAGNSWSVDYYSQVVADGNDLREIDPGQPNILQQYQEIKQLELRVTSELSTSYDSETSITTVNGSAVVYPFLKPNISDYFVTDVGDNRTALFRITNVERQTFNRDSTYAIDYDLVGYTDAVGALYDELIGKVIRHYHFSKDRLVEGLSPILKSSDYQIVSNLKTEHGKLVRKYFDSFYQERYSTLVIPGQTQAVYDGFLVEYLLKITDSQAHRHVSQTKQLSTDKEPYLEQPQFWDMLLHRNTYLLNEVNRTMGLVSKHLFNNNSYLHELRYSNIDSIIYPIATDGSTAVYGEVLPKSTSTIDSLEEVDGRNVSVGNRISGTYVTDITTYQDIHLVTVDDHYVLSQDYYDETANMSLLEILTKDYVNTSTIDLDKLMHLVNRYNTWGRLEQYYYGPILMTLLLEADRSTYS